MQQRIRIDEATVTPVPMPSGLVYVSDAEPGFRRVRCGRGFRYLAPDRTSLSDEHRARIRSLGIPPAYEDVWICAVPNGHLQATGLDARGRKQYRYHPLWGEARAETKYQSLATFAEALPSIRAKIGRDLKKSPGDKDFTLAALILLLDQTHMRIGNPEYAAQNRSFGATTLLSRHLKIKDGAVRLSFVAKGGKRARLTLQDKRLNRILQEIGDLPGRNLFKYIDAAGSIVTIGSHHVNGWLADIAGAGMTAKTFRTWGGTLAAFEVARSRSASEKLTMRDMAEAAANRLINTPTISRKSYIHPAVLGLSELTPQDRVDRLGQLAPSRIKGLRASERHLLALLQAT